jgi:predicted nucleic acid-binding protein
MVFSEISMRYRTIQDVGAAVPLNLFRREDTPWDAAFLAGKCFLDYRRRGGCRTAPLPDFFIGAHAAVRGYRLLTGDLAPTFQRSS